MSIQSVGGAGGAATLQQLRDKLFNRADADRSGGVSLAEFQKLGRPGSAGASAATAAPRDSTAAQRLFRALDTNRDGSLSAAELAAARPPAGAFRPDGLATLLDAQARQGTDPATGLSPGRAGTGDADAQVLRLLAAYTHANQLAGQGVNQGATQAPAGRIAGLGEV